MFKWLKSLFKKSTPPKPVETKPVVHEPVTEAVPFFPAVYTIALAEVGQQEIRGGKHNPRIVEYHQKTSLKAKDDETMWCASFVCWCLEKANIKSPRSARAKDFLGWGKVLLVPSVGCIAVFKRDTGGHVGFVAEVPKKGDKKIKILGGNQSNQVKVSSYSLDDLLGYRTP